MSESLNEFRLSLEGKVSISRVSQADRNNLISRGMEAAKTLSDLGLTHVKIPYLSASSIEMTVHGLGSTRANIALNKVPYKVIQELVEKSEELITKTEESMEAVIEKFPTEIAEICFEDSKVVGNKAGILKNLKMKKNAELVKCCNDRIPKVKVCKGMDVTISFGVEDISCYIYGIGSPSPSLSLRGTDRLKFLEEFEHVKDSLLEGLDTLFREPIEVEKMEGE